MTDEQKMAEARKVCADFPGEWFVDMHGDVYHDGQQPAVDTPVAEVVHREDAENIVALHAGFLAAERQIAALREERDAAVAKMRGVGHVPYPPSQETHDLGNAMTLIDELRSKLAAAEARGPSMASLRSFSAVMDAQSALWAFRSEDKSAMGEGACAAERNRLDSVFDHAVSALTRELVDREARDVTKSAEWTALAKEIYNREKASERYNNATTGAAELAALRDGEDCAASIVVKAEELVAANGGSDGR